MEDSFGRQFGYFLKGSIYSHHEIQLLAFAQRSWKHMSSQKPPEDFYRSFTSNCQNLEARCPPVGTQLRYPSIAEWVNKLLYPDIRILFRTKTK